MSSDQEFSIKINGIIGKAWLVSLDDSEGHILSFKPFEGEKKAEEQATVVENNLPDIASPVKSHNTLNQPTNQELMIESQLEYRTIKLELGSDFNENLRESEKFRCFLQQVNDNIRNTDILPIRYEELGITTNEKFKDLIDKFEEQRKLKLLKKILDNFIKFNNN